MQPAFLEVIKAELEEIRGSGLYKKERVLFSPQQANIEIDGGKVINFCANNYLGLANHPDILDAARKALETYGLGMASVRFICGTHNVHKKLEERIARFLKMEDAILYSSCFDANAGLFETILNDKDAVISDRLVHASIIDGIRLCKATRFRYNHDDMDHLATQLKRAEKYRFRLIATDGVFSMDGDVAQLKEICGLADQYGAMVMVDDSHATGFFGPTGRGCPEYRNVMDRIDIITSTFGKALGGASGGFASGKKEIIEILRQRSRPYLFSNSLSPVVAATTLMAIDLIEKSPHLINKLRENTLYFKTLMDKAGFAVKAGEHPIIPIILGDAKLSQQMAEMLLKEGINVIGFSYPVVPKDSARIRVQISSVHEKKDIAMAVKAFKKIGTQLGVLNEAG